jgi:hypothetical protein
VKKSKEIQGLLYKCAELETLVVVLIGMLGSKDLLTVEEVESIFEVATIPEILGARIKRIEEQGVCLIEARKKILRENLGIDTPPGGEIFNTGEPIIEEALDDVGLEEANRASGEPDKKLH